jgi:hypothetical protein
MSVFPFFLQNSSKRHLLFFPKGQLQQPKTGLHNLFLALYFCDIQTLIKNLKKNRIYGAGVSKKYYLCHRKNDEDVH